GKPAGHQWAVLMATSGKKHWPPMGRTQWPLTTQRPPGTPPCPGPRRGRTNRPATATVVVSIGRASARPSDARCRRWGGGTRRPPSAPYPGGDAPRAWPAPWLSAASCPPATRRGGLRSPGAAGERRAVADTGTGSRAAHSPAVQGSGHRRPTPLGGCRRPRRRRVACPAPLRGTRAHGARLPLPPTRRDRSWSSVAAVYVERKAGCYNGGLAVLSSQGNAAGRTPEGIRPAAWERRPGQWAYLPRENS
ncbi:hypothetical protein ACUXMM_001513, partial [Micrococcus aloeverae]